jgi:hypothetical protein
MAAPSVASAGQGRIYFDSTANKFKVSQNGGAYADLVPAGASSQWTTSGSDIYYSTGKVSIGTATANKALTVQVANNTDAADFNQEGTRGVRIGSAEGAGQNPGIQFYNTGVTNFWLKPSGGCCTDAQIGSTSAIEFDANTNWNRAWGMFNFNTNGGLAGSNLDQSYFEILPKVKQTGTAGYAGLLVNVTETTTGSGKKNLLELQTAGTSKFLVTSAGSVGIGTTSPRASLDVSAGAMIGKASVVNATSTIDFSTGNLQHTTNNCGAFALQNMKDGGSYTFIVKGTTSTTCSFTAYSDAGTTALTVRLPPGHGATTATKHTIYSMIVAGTDVYLSWVPGY